MERIINSLKDSFKRGNIYIQLIYINVGIFVLVSLLVLFAWLFQSQYVLDFPARYLWLNSDINIFLHRPWTIISYMFLHADVWHILFNMLCLYWFGFLFLNFFSSKHLRGLYILGGIVGGLFFIMAYNIFPAFEAGGIICGASASVLALIVACAYREPNYQIRLFLIGNVKLKYVALFMVILDVLVMPSGNAGGHIAHLGGAVAGLLFAVGLSKGIDLTLWINFIMDWFTNLFSGFFLKRGGKPKMKVRYNTTRQQDYDYNARKKAQSDEIDRILDKLKKSGYDSLTSEEKKSLFDASKR